MGEVSIVVHLVLLSSVGHTYVLLLVLLIGCLLCCCTVGLSYRGRAVARPLWVALALNVTSHSIACPACSYKDWSWKGRKEAVESQLELESKYKPNCSLNDTALLAPSNYDQ